MATDTTEPLVRFSEDIEEWSDLHVLDDAWMRDVFLMVVGFLLAIVLGWAVLYAAGIVLVG